MKEQINNIKDLLYSGQKVNVDLAISIMQGLDLTWNSKGFEDEKKIVDLCGVYVFTETALIFWRKKLSILPRSITKLHHLKELWLSDNQIKAIPESIGQLQNLKWLGLRHNPISESEINKIKKLLPNCNVIY